MNAQEWRQRADAHAARIDAYVAPHLARRDVGTKHPVFDFLFTYYSHRPAQLRRWHPGFGVTLEGAEEYAGLKGYGPSRSSSAVGEERAGGISRRTVTAEYVASQRPLVQTLHRLLSATAGRAPHFGCFGLHEWAMVYRLAEDETRHADWPLRLGPAGTDEVVVDHKIACSHFDAFRFFTPPARPLNTLSPGPDDRPVFEQPGCLHAGMDLYGKVAVRLSPMICSDLVADAFELAWDIRVMDMRAAPYDLSGVELGTQGEWTPIKIETADGKREYAEAQRIFAERGAPIRLQLANECERLLNVAAH